VGDLDLIGVNHEMSWETIVYMVSNIIITKSKNHVERRDFNDLSRELSLWMSFWVLEQVYSPFYCKHVDYIFLPNVHMIQKII